MSYEQLVLEFLSTLHVDWAVPYRDQEVVISFLMFNMYHRISLRRFNALLHLPIYADGFGVLSWWKSHHVRLNISCSKRKTYTNRFARPQVHYPT